MSHVGGVRFPAGFDSGAPFNVISKETADRINIDRYPKLRMVYDWRLEDTYSPGYLVPLRLGDIEFDNVLYVTQDNL
jgi:hypothetical protein